MNDESPEKSKKGYSKRPVWQWVALYVFIGAIVYGLIYVLFLYHGNGSAAGGGFNY